ncbi:MAG: thioesterase family protein [Vulcanimicrobiaceae bacterium]
MDEQAAFYEALDETHYRSGAATMSPWDPRMQHGGPPAALLWHALVRAHPRDDARLARFTLDFLGPIPRADLEIRSEVVRPGRRVELLEATLAVAGRAAVVARAWRIASAPELASRLPPPASPHPAHALADARESALGLGPPNWPYGRAIAWRFIERRDGSGRARVWTRLQIPLVAGRTTTPLEHLLVVADSANGLAAALPMDEWLFVPPGLGIVLARAPDGDWLYLDARTRLAGDGLGFTEIRFGDRAGELGIGAQPLLVAPREPANLSGG